ncbi:MAG: sugar kinase [Chloroflexi bacterium]|nr:sugar kinase [Chloroflexota bacterium]
MSILVVGSVALDSMQTPFGRVKDALGGAATYFSIAASLYDQVNLVGVVGTDFPPEHLEFLESKKVDLRGLQVKEGRTFRWSGRYDYDMGAAETLDTQLNVFADFHPRLPQGYELSDLVFLANIDPELQVEVLRQVKSPRLTVLDTMNYWISYKKDTLSKALSLVDIVLINEAEARQYSNTFSLIRAARKILDLGPKALVIKKGEYGAVLFYKLDSGDGHPVGGKDGSFVRDHTYFFAPAYPLEKIKDPTGAGDGFAGGFIGYLSRVRNITADELKRAVVHGSVIASFVVEDFSIDRLRSLHKGEVLQRYQEFKHFTHFEHLCVHADTCEMLRLPAEDDLEWVNS